MLTEHERQDGPEEGEYHFSDEGGYDSNEEEAKAPVVTESSGLAAKFSHYRRFVILGAIAAGVLLIAYLLIPPLTTLTSTEITAVNTPPLATPVSPSTKTLADTAPAALSAEDHKLTKGATNLMSRENEKITAEKEKVMAHFREQPPAPPPALEQPSQRTRPEQYPMQPPPGQIAGAEPLSPPLPEAPPPAAVSPAQDYINAPVGSFTATAAATQASVENKAAMERLTAMAETNTKLIGQMHVEYAQKVADYEAQNKALQEQVRTLNARLAGMETEMSKLVQASNNKPSAPAGDDNRNSLAENTVVTLPGNPSAAPLSPPPPVSQGAYKSSYTVQAIIPGRAWLRTEGGETITVAEGDMLKSLGRVTKIDPYDGTILIDTGVRVITLTYGNGDYA